MTDENNNSIEDKEGMRDPFEQAETPADPATKPQQVELPLSVRAFIPITLFVSVLTLIFVLVMMSQVSGQLKSTAYDGSGTLPPPTPWPSVTPPPPTPMPSGYMHDGFQTIWKYTGHDGTLTNFYPPVTTPIPSPTPSFKFGDGYTPPVWDDSPGPDLPCVGYDCAHNEDYSACNHDDQYSQDNPEVYEWLCEGSGTPEP